MTSAQPSAATPFNAALGAVQALGIGFGLWIFATRVTAAISATDLPEGYTAQNIAITVRTIVQASGRLL